MKKEFAIKSLNLSGVEVLMLEKGRDRVEFEVLSAFLMTPLAAGGSDVECWYLFTDPCYGLIPEPPTPFCVMWYNPDVPPDDQPPQEPPPQNPAPPEPPPQNPAPPCLSPAPMPCWSDMPPTPPTPPFNPNPGGDGGGE